MPAAEITALMQQHFANVRKPTDWGDVLPALAVALGRNGFDESDVLDPIKAECRRRGCPERDAFIESKIKKGVAEGQSQALAKPAQVNGKPYVGKPQWRERRGNSPAPSFYNAQEGIRQLGLLIRYDSFHDKTTIECADGTAHDLSPLIGELTDAALVRLRNLFSETYNFDVGEKNVYDAVRSLAVVFDPVRDMIDTAQAAWDGKPRLDRMAAHYLSAEDTELNSQVIRKHMIAAVRRVRRPGCKYDVMTVLEGPEGWNKSSAIRIIAGAENFSDAPILAASPKEQMELVRPVWHYECAELAGLRKADNDHLKAFISRTEDTHRPAYARTVARQLRHLVFWGTTNDSQYLLSQTGNRRFAPLRVLKSIDLDKLARDRLQLIGEAARYESKGETLPIPESLWGTAREEQDKRRIADPWEAKLAQIPATFTHLSGDGRELISVADILSNVLQIPPAQQTAAMGKRIAQAMELNGWARPDNPIKIGGKNTRGYWRYVEGGDK